MGVTSHAGVPRYVGEGPYDRLISRDVTGVDGSGAPAYGPADIVLDAGRIARIHLVGHPTGPRLREAQRPALLARARAAAS